MSKVKSNEYEEEVEYYLNSLKRQKNLSREEEKALGRRIQDGDHNALNTLVEHNLPFVVNVAKNYRGRGALFSDIISEGNLGLIHAARKFNPDKDIKFISYAVWWVRYYIDEFIKRRTSATEVSGDEYGNSQYDDSDYVNMDFEEKLNNLNDMTSTIADLLVCLKERERKIIEMSFGLNGTNEMTLNEISKVINISIERVRQLKDTALTKIKCQALSYSTEDFNEIRSLY